MVEEKQFWRNKVETFRISDFESLQATLNNFYKDRFVIATQIFPVAEASSTYWYVVIYYKVSPEEQKAEEEQR